MKIGILTQPLGENYGGILQNWALQHVLKKLGFESETIFYRYKSRKRILLDNIECLVRYILKYLIFHPTRKCNKYPGYYTKPYKKLRNFIKKHISHTPFLNIIDYKYLTNSRGIEAFIVGSDQVWRPKYNFEFYFDMFCAFIPEDANCKRIAYAASFGVDNWELNHIQTEIAKRNLSKFNAISVRERSGVDLCRNYIAVEAQHVLDPTLLLSNVDYKNIAKKTEVCCYKGKLGIYILDHSQKKCELINNICRLLKLDPIYIGESGKKSRLLPSVEEWLAAFDNCEFIVTDSFHGTVFSIIFHKSFYNIINSSRGCERIYSLLSLLNLADRIIENTEVDISNAYIDDSKWAKVEDILASKRKESINFLRTNLN